MNYCSCNFVVAYKVGLFEAFEEGELAEVYDLSKDPNAYYNINDNIRQSDIQYLIDPIKQRWEELKKDTLEFVNNLKKEEDLCM